MRKAGNRFAWGVGALVATLPSHVANAQDVSASPETAPDFDRDRTVAILDRAPVGFEEKGYRAGAFLILPRVEYAGMADDNVLALPRDRTGDVGVSIAPSIDAQSDWVRHQLALSASGVFTRFATLQSENSETYNLQARGRFDATGELSVTGLAGYRRSVERRSAPGALRNSVRPVTYDTVSAGGRITWRGGRLRLQAEGDLARLNYEDVTTADGTVLDSSGLDRKQSRVSSRADYAITPDLALLAVATVTDLDYKAPAFGIDRTSRKTEVLAGVSFEFTDLLRGEIALGYVRQHYKRGGIPNFSGLGGRIELEYYPTRLTGIKFEGSRTVREAGNPIAPSYIRTRAQLSVDHELYRRLVMSAVADYERNRYQFPARTEQRWHAGLSARYLMSRHVAVFARVDHLRVATRPSEIGRRFTENVVSLGILLKP